MKLIDRYVARSIAGATLIVMLVLLSLFSFIAFVTELGDVGRGSYGVLQAAEYVVLSLPRMAYQLMSLAALVGTMSGLGLMASSGELVAIRAAGVSTGRIVLSVMKIGVVITLLGGVLGELIAPISEQYAQNLRATALDEGVTLRTARGYWVRDGQRYINMQEILPGGALIGVSVYEFTDDGSLGVATRARQALYEGDRNWTLIDVERSRISEQRVETQRFDWLPLATIVTPDLLDRVTVKPDFMSIWDLHRYIVYLRTQSLSAARYDLAFWNKVVAPFATAVMVFLAVPFVFGSLRTVGVGQRIVTGVALGMAFYVIDQAFGYLGLVYGLDPRWSAATPTLGFSILGLALLKRVR